MPSTKCLLLMQQQPLVNGLYSDTNCSRTGFFFLGCPALGCSPRVGLLLRWSHSCLFMECPFVPHPSSLPPFCLPILRFYPTFTQGGVAPQHLRKSDAFLWFSSWFFLFAQILCRNAWWEIGGQVFLPQLFIILWTNSSRGFWERGEGRRREEEQGTGHQNIFLFVLFDF